MTAKSKLPPTLDPATWSRKQESWSVRYTHPDGMCQRNRCLHNSEWGAMSISLSALKNGFADSARIFRGNKLVRTLSRVALKAAGIELAPLQREE